MSDEYKDQHIIQCCRNPHPGSIGQTQDHHIDSQRTDLSGEGQTDETKDLPNSYSRSTAETIMNYFGQNIPVICLHLETITNKDDSRSLEARGGWLSGSVMEQGV